METSTMAAAPRHTRQTQEESGRQPRRDNIPQKKAGRPKGVPSTIVNLRLPVDLLAQLNRYIDRLESETGLKANRGMIARRALELFLETRSTGNSQLAL